MAAPSPAILTFSCAWSHVPGLRLHLLLSSARRRLPLLLSLLAVAAALRGFRAPPGPRTLAVCAALAYSAQRAAGYVASLLIMMGQRGLRVRGPGRGGKRKGWRHILKTRSRTLRSCRAPEPGT